MSPSWWTQRDSEAVRDYHRYRAGLDECVGGTERSAWQALCWSSRWHSCRTCAHWMSDQGSTGHCMCPAEERGTTEANNGCEDWEPRSC